MPTVLDLATVVQVPDTPLTFAEKLELFTPIGQLEAVQTRGREEGGRVVVGTAPRPAYRPEAGKIINA